MHNLFFTLFYYKVQWKRRKNDNDSKNVEKIPNIMAVDTCCFLDFKTLRSHMKLPIVVPNFIDFTYINQNNFNDIQKSN